jgi:hypothetical protein
MICLRARAGKLWRHPAPSAPWLLCYMPTRVAALPASDTPPRRYSGSARLGLLSDSSPSTPRSRRSASHSAGRVLPVTPGPATRALDVLLRAAGNDRCADCSEDAPRWASVRRQQPRATPPAPPPPPSLSLLLAHTDRPHTASSSSHSPSPSRFLSARSSASHAQRFTATSE